MKMQSHHYTAIDVAIRGLFAQYGEKLAAHKTALCNDPRVKDVAKRFRWDVFSATGITATNAHNIRPGENALPLYDYLDDSHIDTALKRIIADIEA